MDCYYKLQHLFYYKVRHGLLQIATGITKRDDYYKLRQPVTQLEQSNELKAAKLPLLFVKETRRSNNKSQKQKKEIEDAKLLLCR